MSAVSRYATMSSYFASLAEHVLLADLMTYGWYERGISLQVLRAEVDVAGYDVVLADDRVLRHVQFKAGQRSPVPISLRLCEAPSGCVVWARLREPSDGWRPKVEYRYLGGAPGDRLTVEELGDRVTRRPKSGTLREGHRDVNWTAMEGPFDGAGLYERLFGYGPPPTALGESAVLLGEQPDTSASTPASSRPR